MTCHATVQLWRYRRMRFLKSDRGSTTVEWVVVVVIVIVFLGGITMSISDSLADKLTEFNDAL
jgi:Flp pilus assembly pilin Flp